MIHTMTIEARHLPDATTHGTVWLRELEGVVFDHPGEPDSGRGLLVEAASLARLDGDSDTDHIELSLWHGAAWMFGMQLALDDQVTVQVETHLEELHYPDVPNRIGQVRVHGTWKSRGEVAWAPEGYPR